MSTYDAPAGSPNPWLTESVALAALLLQRGCPVDRLQEVRSALEYVELDSDSLAATVQAVDDAIAAAAARATHRNIAAQGPRRPGDPA